MPIDYFLAVDIGASSGRHILGSLQDGKLVLEEVYRFHNGMKDVGGTLCWDADGLFHEILEGLKKCAALGKIPATMGIDTWGVDFVLLDKADRTVGKTVAYRDMRTEGMYEVVDSIVPESRQYAVSGIQRMAFNTIFQLMAVKRSHPEWLDAADALLLMPDYFGFRLTGRRSAEYTFASTTQLLDASTRQWSWELIDALGFPRRIFQPIQPPGSVLGDFTPEVRSAVGFNCTVVRVGSHDTASAVLAVPATTPDFLYISSGTWSLFGTELSAPNCTEASRTANFTNEGGYGFRIRYLKNIMGFWMIQSVRNEFEARGETYEFTRINAMAEAASIPTLVECDDPSFFSPKSMTQAIIDFCRKTSQPVPATLGEFAAVALRSQARRYAVAVKEMEGVTGKRYGRIHVVGGGAQNAYLNRLTAAHCGCEVLAGPVEATAIGNLAAQMIARGHFPSVDAVRKCICDSFEVTRY